MVILTERNHKHKCEPYIPATPIGSQCLCYMLACWLAALLNVFCCDKDDDDEDSLRFPLAHTPISYNLSTLMFIKLELFSHTPDPMSCHMIEKPSNEIRCFREFNRFIGLQLRLLAAVALFQAMSTLHILKMTTSFQPSSAQHHGPSEGPTSLI